ncbi:wax ester synthase/diacylglycerol acyltransferase 4-like [Macadamia integrifolia]|uniref:wax ester synthase/diacylglycerol acyltransferase 4-like n=1 Tax=Macadamia integrifolia TaxID=60698 RepID=UPI001C50213D|nr:wax ester synthase/diacylglycerol acyltransferase 4-like [Macadamia integrifolia]
MDQLPESRPPWEVHAIMYPTTNATMSLVFRLNHALGDGYSLMSGMFSSFRRTDNPSLPITFPSSSLSSSSSTTTASMYGRMNSLSKMSSFISRCLNTVSDSIITLLQGMFLEDDKTTIRSATPRVEFELKTIASVVFNLDEIRQLKNIVGCTVNDVIIGLISFTIHLYMQRLEPGSGHKRVSALVLMNMRTLKGYQNVEDLLKAKEWGNQFGLLSISLPLFKDSENVSPLEFIVQAKKEMGKKKNSAGIYFSAILMNVLKNIISSKVVAGLMHSTCKHTSIGISNIIGPMQKVALAGNPVNGFYFTVGGIPQSLSFTVMSYNQKLRVITAAEKGFIDSELLISCMKEAFGNIVEAARRK